MNRRIGLSVATLFPWIVAVAAIAFAGWSRFEGPVAPRPAPDRGGGSTAEIHRLRLALAASSSEAAALREELDRLLDRVRRNPSPDSAKEGEDAPAAAETPASGESPARLAELAETYQAALLRSIGGDEAAGDEAYEAVMRLLRSGPAAFPALRDAYLSTSDPEARIVMLRSVVASQGTEARAFVASQLETETDPAVRSALAVRAAELSGPGTAPLFRDSFLEILRSSDDPDMRAASVRGLRHLRGDEDARDALFAAASDPAKAVRIAAYENLAFRPAFREQLRALVAEEPDETARAVGRCRLLLADQPVR